MTCFNSLSICHSFFPIFPSYFPGRLKHFVAMNFGNDKNFGLIDFRWEKLEGNVTLCM